MGSELTVRQKILVAATNLGDEVEAFSVEDLIVRSWNLFPEAFSLRGYFSKYPDSNRVLAKLSGVDGLCGLGWLEHTDQRMYRVTRKGKTVSKQLLSMVSGVALAPVAPSAEDEVVEAPAVKSIAPKREEPRASKPPAKRSEGRSSKSDSAPPKSTVQMTAQEIVAVGVIAKSEALRKFLRGSPLTFADACAFWGISQGRPVGVQQKLDAIEELLKHVVGSFGAEGAADPRLPPLSTCYGLLNLHKLMLGRFSRELESLKVQLATG